MKDNTHLLVAWLVLALLFYWAVSRCGTRTEYFNGQPPYWNQTCCTERDTCPNYRDNPCGHLDAEMNLKDNPWNTIFGDNVTVCAKPGKDGRPLMKDGQPVQIDNCSQCANCALLKSNGDMGSSLCIPLQPSGYIYGDHNSQSLSDPSLWDTGNKNSVYLDCGDT